MAAPRLRTAHPYAFLMPYVLINAVFFLLPLIKAIPLALQQTNGPRSRVFVGLSNFHFILTDLLFHRALLNVTVFALASVCIMMPLSLGLAMLLNVKADRLKGAFRLLLITPQLVGAVFVGIVFSVMFTPRYGVFNIFIQQLLGWGLEEKFLENPALVMPALIITNLWMNVGFNMILYLAALQSVDRSLIDAAKVDGANRWQVFRFVTIPSIRHVSVFILVTSMIGSYQLYELPLTLLSSTSGHGSDNSGFTIMAYLYEYAFNVGDLGMGAATGWLLALIIFAITMTNLAFTRAAKEK